ncbi:UDP-N-acetylglucosamine diphosphorylase/glucosamine-1-phosphate N-acetyltransferase [Malaciobacter mytili LMG 24559]|uniref:Bifunctional protein GlmU n=1 Tax=Malaciobacter mytili LMG 24559 TaxID=1032238 RepID=A0AAX2ACZ7_9BACT|nr:bifunctional UDP-N-acetylglucosamine diphosphorylase/glucosamine-1-phosphate N-acetyltransferase GlmU [Malaciobacter mytili]AXH16119.1 fused N-acetylglucosamine-1-phosphate uridyltransferase and glucosamine-1-phosphate acetyltransferase [Malaciobacter mytili LMG 24559]RXK14904.1 UDP-N-acetylglucosamine diphosphorylase/glucosamine-1-phosphate N-acetyltransferase [Malaciobacter mytili LMG 24559]
MNNLSIVILAAGAGTRMKSEKPKVLHNISGKPMLYYSIKEALKLSDDITVVLYHQASRVQAQMEKYFKDIKFVIQDHENYPGTGGAVMNVEPKYEKTLVLNADMPLIQAIELEKFNIDATIVMSVLKLDDASGYGRVVIKDENVVKIVEQKDANEQELKITTANAGVYLFQTAFLKQYLPLLSNDNAQQEYYITDLIELAIKDGKTLKPLYVSVENFKGVNSKYELSQAEVIHQNRIKKEFMQNGVIMRLPDTIYIEEGVSIEGECILENGVSLLGNTKIVNSIVKANSIIEDSHLEDSDVGPMARIRPGSNLKNTHIGNFVETKKALLNGVKAGHLSYLGDCEMDTGTNVGAGTITCNYDGVNKHKTKVGKNVFIGSDTQLVAPVVIEDDVILAAGACITKNVPKGSLAITRAPIKIIENYFYKFFKK